VQTLQLCATLLSILPAQGNIWYRQFCFAKCYESSFPKRGVPEIIQNSETYTICSQELMSAKVSKSRKKIHHIFSPDHCIGHTVESNILPELHGGIQSSGSGAPRLEQDYQGAVSPNTPPRRHNDTVDTPLIATKPAAMALHNLRQSTRHYPLSSHYARWIERKPFSNILLELLWKPSP